MSGWQVAFLYTQLYKTKELIKFQALKARPEQLYALFSIYLSSSDKFQSTPSGSMICSDLYDPCRREQWRTCMDDGPPDINTSVLDNQYSREKELFKSLCDIEFPIPNSNTAFSRLFFVSGVRRTRKWQWLILCRQRIDGWGELRHGSGTRWALSTTEWWTEIVTWIVLEGNFVCNTSWDARGIITSKRWN
jgi:hypothetical protein